MDGETSPANGRSWRVWAPWAALAALVAVAGGFVLLVLLAMR